MESETKMNLKVISTRSLHTMERSRCLRTLRARFPWIGPASLLDGLVDVADNRRDESLKWHIPRIVATAKLCTTYIRPRDRVIDISSYPAVSVLLAEHSAGTWSRSSFAPAEGEIHLDLTAPDWVVAPGSFDCAIFTEVLEHLDEHPQVVLSKINGILAAGGRLILTTPNVASWKKLLMLSRGEWSYDSPTFFGHQGHRYEYSYYDVKTLMERSGFRILEMEARDVYLDDPAGFSAFIQMTGLSVSKILCGEFRGAAKLWLRRGSVSFVVAEKEREPRVDLLRV